MSSFYFTYPLPDLYATTHLRNTFPEHHHLFDPTLHKLKDMINPFYGGDEIHTPRADIRETMEKYYIDVELAGLEDEAHLKVKWINKRTLLMDAQIIRPPIEESKAAADVGKVSPAIKGNEEETPEQTHTNGTTHETPKQPIHLTVTDRQVGKLVRAFGFPVDVDQDSLVAKLRFGLLRIVVSKEKHEQVTHKQISVEHGDS